MGDRGNIVVQFEEGKLWMYTHWCGTQMPNTLAAALKRGRDRWNDSSYLARVIFCELIRHDDIDEVTGFGLSVTMGDNGHDILVVDTRDDKVKVYVEDGLNGKPKETYGYEEFIKKYGG